MKNLIKLSLAVAFLAGFSACKNAEKSDSSEEKELESGILVQNMDTTVRPGNDFHAYVNGKWIKETEIPADKASYGAGYMVQEQAEEDVKEIILSAAEDDHPEGSAEQKVGDLYASYMNSQLRDSLGMEPLKEDLQKIENISSYDELASYFAYANRSGLYAPLSSFVYQDFKDPSFYTVYVVQSGLGLPDREYYLSEDARSKEIRKAYVDHIQKMFELAGWQNGQKSAKNIMSLETEMAASQMKKEDTRNMQKLYNMYGHDEALKLMPDFNFEKYLSGAGINRDTIGIAMVDYTKSLNDIIKSHSLDTWKTYLKWGLLNASSNELNSDIYNEDFNFYRKELRGIQEPREQWRRGVAVVNSNLGEVVGKVYVEKHFPPEAKKRMEDLVQNLLKAYEESIKNLDWMSEDTKKQALDKLNNINTKIGYPDKWKDYSDLKITANDLYGNIKRSSQFQYQVEIDKLDGPIDREEWGMTPQTVNAYYNPTMNEIVFPAAILQPPFFNLEADDAVNYGAIGAVIGHEIGHGFDDQGSKFDGSGAMRNWWTDEDRKEFEKRTASLTDQYNQFEVIDSVHVNGEFTLGENIGDLGGLSIALKAYKKSLDGKEAKVIDGFTPEQRVFLGYGQAWLQKSREEALRMQVSTDPHSPAKFRVNGVVRNVPEFYKAFDVKPGDSLYLAEDQRVKIW
ncbi:peptidase M13 [Christiangramia fulva]|uniref:Peptidase M13 n=1 Tax=Christiangramia fulva TaxID=2126553 RepID=A0A2R3Z6R3_9FLAO|nr:M13 family metallopeptidase [Christiangramia fulva]AVR45966.1 peptidase M13 [Christiangramia fulva]